MLKRLLSVAVLLLGLTFGCSSTPEQSLNGWCYLHSGLYLITGDEAVAETWAYQEKPYWPYGGFVLDVFFSYNNNMERCIEHRRATHTRDVRGYNTDDNLIVIVYKSGVATYHSEPYTTVHDREIVEFYYSYNCEQKEVL